MPVQTRSMTRRQQNKHRRKVIDIDSGDDDSDDPGSGSESESEDDNSGTPVYIEVDEANINERRELRDKLLNTIFNKQNINAAFKYKQWPEFDNREFNWVCSELKKTKNINVYGVPNGVAQAQLAGSLLDKSISKKCSNLTCQHSCDKVE